ncbi:centrosomal protein of 85 kDa-like [Stylophora pistillata]|nr:centrosomal protein of 85 kDa-like [Stylophora pistillata]
MQGLNTGIQQPWGSSLRLNELHMQTNASDNGLTGFTGQMPLNNGTGIQASQTMPTGTSAPSMRSTISTGYPAPLSHITNSSTSHRNSPLNLIGEGYISSSNSTSRSISPSSDDSDKWSSYLRAKDELIGQKDEIIDRQKQSIFQLQQQLMLQTNSVIHRAVPTHYHLSRTQSTGDSSSLSLKLQESQYENAQLRALLAERESSLDKAQKKLGETEYLLKNMEASVKDSAASNRQELEQQKQKVVKQEKAQAELSSKLEQLEEEKLKLK